MKKELVVKLHGEFEATVHTEADAGIEYWYAREVTVHGLVVFFQKTDLDLNAGFVP